MQLPRELIEVILEFLPHQQDLVACLTVDRRWSEAALGILSNDDAVFKAIRLGHDAGIQRILSMNPYHLRFHDLAVVVMTKDHELVDKFLQSPRVLKEWKSTPIDSYGRSPLVAAVVSRNVELVKQLLLINYGERINFMAPDRQGWTPLQAVRALETPEFTKLETMYRRGRPLPHGTNHNKNTCPLSLSSIQSDLLSALKLAMPGYRDEEASTLHQAALANSITLAQAGLRNGVDFKTAAGAYGHTPLFLAAWAGSFDVARLLIDRGADVTHRTYQGNTPLHMTNHPLIAKLLLEHGAVLEVAETWYFDYQTRRRTRRVSPLIAACQAGNEGIIETLLITGADPKVCNAGGFTTLHAAAVSGLIDGVKMLAKAGISVNQPACKLWSPLHSAARNGNLDMIQVLVELGADMHATTEDGITVMYVASHSSDAVKLLIRLGLDINARNSHDGSTILHSKGSNSMHLASTLGRLIALGADMSLVDNDGNTPMHSAVEQGQLAYVKALQRRGANIEIFNNEGDTPLASACRFGRIPIVQYLVDSGADVDAGGGRALQLACKQRSRAIMILLRAGADGTMVLKQTWYKKVTRLLSSALPQP